MPQNETLLQQIAAHLKSDQDWFLSIIKSRQTAYMPPQAPQQPQPSQTPSAIEMPNGMPLNEPQIDAPTTDYLTKMCEAIRDYEGGPGDLNYQNNNPGNCRCSSLGYLPKYGNVLCVETASGKFAKFPTYELGWEYLMALVKERIHSNPNWTLLNFFDSYSPSSDNNDPQHYAIFVARRMGILISQPLSMYI